MSQTLYRFWDTEGLLLYVGITARPWERWKAHRNEKPWWEEVASVTLQNFASREEVIVAELKAIREEKPRYNIAGTSDQPKPSRPVRSQTAVQSSADAHRRLVEAINVFRSSDEQLDATCAHTLTIDFEDFR